MRPSDASMRMMRAYLIIVGLLDSVCSSPVVSRRRPKTTMRDHSFTCATWRGVGVGVGLRVFSVVVCLAGLLVLGGAIASGASAESLCTDTWTGPAEGAWETASDWSSGKVPSSTDVACIGLGKKVGVSSAGQVASVVQGEGTLALSGGSLEVTSLLEASNIKTLTLSKATLTGGATINITGSLDWYAYGSMTGSGSTVLTSGASGEFNAAGNEWMTDNKRVVVNEGAIKFPEGDIRIEEEGRLQNRGTFEANSESGGTQIEGNGLIVNAGTLEKTSGTGGTNISVPLENTGIISNKSGNLNFSSKTLTLSTGCVLEGILKFYNGTTITAGAINARSATITLLGTESATSSLSINSGSTATIGTLTINRGTVTGEGTLDISGVMKWYAYGSMTGTGKTVLLAGASGEFNGTGLEWMTLSKRLFVNESTIAFPEGDIRIEEGAQLQNRGTFKANSETAVQPHMQGNGTFDNIGTLEKTAGTGFTEDAVPTENYGSVRTLTGTLKITKPIVVEHKTQYGKRNRSALSSVGCRVGDPVDCQTGNFYESQSDIAVGGRGVGLDLARTYNAQAAAAGEKGAFGYGWTSSFSAHLTFNTEAHTVSVVQDEGATVTFVEEGGKLVAPAWTQDELSGNGTAGYSLTMSDQTVYKFSGAGRLESVTDRNGNATTLGYNEKGQLVTVTDPAGRAIKLAYNGEGLVETATDPMGHVVKYAYESGGLASVTMPGESSPRWKFKYDTSHRITSVVNGLGGETVNTYNGENQVTVQKEPNGATFKWEYEPFVTKVTNEATGSVTLDEYTSEYELAAVTHGYGTEQATTESFTYNERGEPLTRTDGDGHTTSYEYSPAGDRTLETDAEGHETKWGYDAHHQVTSETLPSGEKTTIEYDEHGNPVKVSRPAPEAKTQETKYEYNGVGEVSAVIDPLARKTTYEYDAYGDRSVEVDPEGDKRTWGYNEDSRRTSEVSPRGNVTGGEPAKYTTTIERDAQGRPVVVSQPGPIVGKPVSRTGAAISGETVEGQTLSAAPGVWEGAPSLSYTYQWERCGATGSGCAAVSGATGSTYVLGSVDVGHRIRVLVTATNTLGSASSTSAVSAVVSTVLMAHYNSQFGSKGAGAGQLASPYGVAVDSHGNVWVADVENNRVDEFSSARAFVEAVGWGVENGEAKLEVCKTSCRAGLKGAGEGELSEPAGVAFSGGNLYVVDSGNDRVVEFNEKSEFVRAFGEKGAGAGQLEGPEAVTAAPGGNVWVSDTKNRRVEEFTSSGTFVETIGWGVSNGESKYEVCTSGCRAGIEGSGAGQFNTPIGVAFDGTNLYVVDNVNDRVEEFNEKSEYVTAFGSKGKEAGQFEETTSIGVEASTGDLYVNDVGDNRIEQFTSAGGFVGQFGGPGVNGAQFKGPQGLAVTSTGSIYVVDAGNDRVQELRPFTAPGNFVAPNISGEMIEAQTLTAGTGIWGAPPVTTYAYQWQRCTSAGAGCVNITGATNNTYTIQNVDTGHQLRVQVTAKNSAGSSTASSHVTQTPAGAHTTKYAYNAEGQVESETNAEGETTTTTYNTSGLPTKVSQPTGQTVETEYDGAGQVVAQTDGNKHVTKYVRNVLEQVTEVIDPLSRKTKKTYDGAGNLATVTDPESRVTTYGYNKQNEVTKISYSEAGMHAVEYAYTPNGQRESMVDGSGTTSYGYDLLWSSPGFVDI